MPGAGRVALGAVAGAIVAAFCAPLIRPLFDVPQGGAGFVTVHQYPKGWDYAVAGLVVFLSFLGGLAASRAVPAQSPPHLPSGGIRRRVSGSVAALVFFFMLFAHDQPYALMDMFHEGERLTPAFVMREGGRPHGDIFLLHGVGTDGGLDALLMGDPPSPWRARRMYTILNAATMALLVPIAVEVCATATGVILAVLLSMAAMGAGQAIGFPYFRLAPLLIATLALLRFARTSRTRWLAVAFSASTLGVLWSLDTGIYAVGAAGLLAAAGLVAARRLPNGREIAAGIAAVVLPLAVLVVIRADIKAFFVDSFIIIPSAVDAIWALPARRDFSLESARYYGPLAFYGFLLALAFRAPAPARRQIVIVTIFALMLFRTAAGRVSWSHTRYAMPLIGIAAAAFLIEPLIRRRRGFSAVAAALPFLLVFETGINVLDGARSVARWPARQRHDGLVRYPLGTGKGLYTTPQNADELAALNGYIHALGPEARFLDFSGERALYYFLQRRPPVRCPDINFLSNPRLLAEAMAELSANPPACVIVAGEPVLRQFDFIPHEVRVPDLARWIDANYPERLQMGRFTVAIPPAAPRP
ncbi:MAG TPA: hypothetical protein VNA04_14735 [Thermoanaerobaculia bacterium]|nr:hypothetical protein [Thermoanaerobaculia bacterium]